MKSASVKKARLTESMSLLDCRLGGVGLERPEYAFRVQLARGTRLGVYEIVEPIGSGGMGEVYRARDERLDRSVAIKILTTDSATRDRIARFEREARAASGLNHPHILHVYDVGASRVSEDSEPIHYIAMELIEGETLRAKLERRAEFRQLVEPLIDVAEALATAHAAGIVHRDLKPENIMVSRDGYAKVLDFGLAKLIDREPSADAATQTLARTATGVVLGTIGYMSPEQVEGREVDARSDIFSFGCILYEALTGERAFSGRSAVDTLHKIANDPAPSIATAAPDLQRIVRKCLAKNPDERYQSIKEVAVDLRGVRRSLELGEARPVARAPFRYGWTALAVILVAFMIVTSRLRPPAAPITPPAPLPFSSIDIERVTFTGDAATAAISRSGRFLAYTRGTPGRRSLWLKQFATGADVSVVAGPQDLGELAFSPDENFIYFEVGDDLKRIPIVGGVAQKIATDVAGMVTFSPDGHRLAYVRQRPARDLVIANLDGTGEQTAYSGEDYLSLPAWSPRENEIVCTSFRENHYPVSLCVIDLRTRTLAVLRESRGLYAWMMDGKALISSRSLPEPTEQLHYVPYPVGKERRITSDLDNYIGVSLTGDGTVIASVQFQASKSIWLMPANKQLTPTVSGRFDGVAMTWAADRTLVYQSFDNALHLKAIKPSGEVVSIIDEPVADRGHLLSIPPSISPDGRSIAYASQVDGAIWVTDREGANRRRVTTGNADMDPQWLDDRVIAYTSHKRVGTVDVMFANNGVWKAAIDGGPAEVIDPMADEIRVSPDRKRILFRRGGKPQQLVLLEADGRRRMLAPHFDVSQVTVQWAPDGAAVDYIGENGQLWRQPLDGSSPRQVTKLPMTIDRWAWSPDGSQLAITRDTRNSDVVLVHDRSRR